MKTMSQEAQGLILFMVKEISRLKYCYKIVIDGCYEMAIKQYGLPVPQESRKEIVDAVIDILNGGCENETI